jgi:hypothetical protein
MAQYVLPDADIATGSWTTTPLWSKVDDDSSANPTGDGTVITSANNTSNDTADFGLASATDPDSGNHILRARWYRNTAGNHDVYGELQLWQGTPGTGTQIATLTSANPIETSEVEDTYTLSAGEVSSITDYTDLSLRLIRRGGTGGAPGGRESLIADLVELEIPDGTTTVSLAGTGPASSDGSGDMDVTASLSGTGAASAAGSGVLSVPFPVDVSSFDHWWGA